MSEQQPILSCQNVSIRYMIGDFKNIGLKEWVMRRLTGRYHVKEFWADKDVTEARRLEARDIGLKTLARLQDLDCDWQRDCKPEHFFLTEDNRVFLIDVESMHFRRVPDKKRAMQTARFLKLLEKAEKRA